MLHRLEFFLLEEERKSHFCRETKGFGDGGNSALPTMSQHAPRQPLDVEVPLWILGFFHGQIDDRAHNRWLILRDMAAPIPFLL